MKKMIFVYDTLVDNFGSDSKHKWHFVDNHAKIANLIKNFINFATIEQFRNFRSEFYRDREDLLNLCKRTLEEAAKNIRNKYELSTQAPEDIKKAIWLLSSLRQINVIYGESEEAEKNKTVIDALRQRFEQEEKKKDGKRGKKRKGARGGREEERGGREGQKKGKGRKRGGKRRAKGGWAGGSEW